MMLAQAATTGATNNEIGLFVVCAAVVFGLVGALVSVASYFATRREVDDLKDRVATIEDLMEKRTEKLHKRINRLLAGQMLIAGQVGVTIENHTAQMSAIMQQLETEED